jgi:putative DNA primase/helicase
MRSSLNLSKGVMSVEADELDAYPEIVNVRNGVLNLRDGTLGQHDPNLFLTKLIDLDYDPAATCPEWQQQLQFIDGANPETMRWVQKAVGYTLAGRGDAKVIPFLFGAPDTGKSTFIEVMFMLFSEYAYKVPVEILLKKGLGSGEGPTPFSRGMLGKRLVSATEMPENSVLDDGLVKDIAGGDTMVSRGLHRDPVNARPTHCVWLYGNNKPDVRDTSGGVFNRLAMVPFLTNIPATGITLMQDMREHFKAELPGILTWAVQGYQMFLQEGLTRPSSIKAATKAYETECDSIQHFLDECGRLDPDKQTEKKLLYEWYGAWAKASGEHRLSKTKLTRTLISRFNVADGDDRRSVVGLELVGTKPAVPQ